MIGWLWETERRAIVSGILIGVVLGSVVGLLVTWMYP